MSWLSPQFCVESMGAELLGRVWLHTSYGGFGGAVWVICMHMGLVVIVVLVHGLVSPRQFCWREILFLSPKWYLIITIITDVKIWAKAYLLAHILIL